MAGFQIIGEMGGVETIATGRQIRELKRLNERYGRGRWRKRKGIARVRLADGTVLDAELHWNEASNLGKFEFKIKRYI